GSFAQVGAPGFDGKGWIVDAPGNVSFSGGAWSVKVKLLSTGSALSTARLVTGMWKVNDAGAVTGGPYVDPTCSSAPCGPGGAPTNSSPLTAAYSDPDGDAGTVDFRVCTAAALAGSQCTGLVASTALAGVASGTSPTWTPALTDGTYYWQAHATDSATNQSAWSATQSFTLDATNPTAALQSPANATLTNSAPALTATYADGGAGDAGTVDLRVCSDLGCSSVVASTSVPSVGDGANATWTPALADGGYYWQADRKSTRLNSSH